MSARNLIDTVRYHLDEAQAAYDNKAWVEQFAVAHVALDSLADTLDQYDTTRAELAELRAQVRHLADEAVELAIEDNVSAEWFAERLRALVGPWPHEADREGHTE